MKSSDLRIGNYYIYKEDSEIQKIDDAYSLYLIAENIKDIEPIELTEEILLKCGFNKIREYFTIYNEFDVFKDNKGYYTHVNCGNIYLNSLHQLQNLYYALCNEELNVKL